MPRPPARPRPVRRPSRRPPGSRVRARVRRRTAFAPVLFRICGGGIFLAILIAYFAPLRRAAERAADVVVEATVASRLASHRTALRSALRYGISVELALAVERAAIAEGIDPDLAFRLVHVESAFRERAVSPVGAIGLTQLMPGTAAALQPGISREEIFDRDTNLRLGFRYLRWLLRVYRGDVAEALHGYNRGPGTVARIRAAGGDPANGYAERVLRNGHSLARYTGSGLLPAQASPLPFSRTR